ncbi:preprotein translocase subunit YajC [Desulfogranum japonicum]|uniref:preprotein translocase subunit YajC n=1 Tax=Desulfogranum japonicum TaxID=231447 RepID=UPI00042159C7|nr:preprotein translocase subunit YajC [Desulfogranum japonicum]
MTGIAYAAGAAPAPGAGGFSTQLIMMALIFGVFYFLLIRPQQKKAKEHQNFLSALKKGDKIVTGGGIHGQITGLTDTVITLEIADGVRIKVNRASVMGSASDAEQAKALPKS